MPIASSSREVPSARKTSTSSALSITSRDANSSDSEGRELLEWENRSRAWMTAYEEKVSKCIEHYHVPKGYVEQSSSSSPRRCQNRITVLSHPEALSAGESRMEETNGPSGSCPGPSTGNSESALDVACLDPEDLTPVPELPPALVQQSHSPTAPLSPQDRSPSFQSDFQKKKHDLDYIEHDTIIEDFSDIEIPIRTKPYQMDKKPCTSLKGPQKSTTRGKRKVDTETNVSSGTSNQTHQLIVSKPTSKKGSKKVKEIHTIGDFEKLTLRDQAERFPTVQLFAKFLNDASIRSSSSVDSKPIKRRRAFLSGTEICYLLDTEVRQKLDKTDRTRMQRLSESGAMLHAVPQLGLTTHIIIGNKVKDWIKCQRLINGMMSDSKAFQSIVQLARGPADGDPGVDLIWVLNVDWLEKCLQQWSRLPELHFCIKPRNSKHAKNLPTDPNTPTKVSTSTGRHGFPVSKKSEPISHGSSDQEGPPDDIEVSISLPPPVAPLRSGLQQEIQLARLGEGHDVEGEEGSDVESSSFSSPHDGPNSPHKSSRQAQDSAIPRFDDKIYQTKYACDRPGGGIMRKDGPNEDICQVLEKICDLYGTCPNDNHRAKRLREAISILRSHPKRVQTDDYKSLCAVRGIGPKTANKIIEIARTGTHSRLKHVSPQDHVRTLFTGIYGVGPSVASTWYQLGLRTLEDVKAKKAGITLSRAQEIGLRYYDDIQEPIPRQEVGEIFEQIRDTALKIDPILQVFAMGSYRRGQETCGDIDIVVTRDDSDGKTHRGAIRELLRNLKRSGLITYDLTFPSDPDAPDAWYMGLCKLPRSGSKQRRIDILGAPFDELGSTLIYFTGNEIFNRDIRLKAQHLGFCLNQRGLFRAPFKDLNRSRSTKDQKGERLASRTEEEIFKWLDVEYLCVFFW